MAMRPILLLLLLAALAPVHAQVQLPTITPPILPSTTLPVITAPSLISTPLPLPITTPQPGVQSLPAPVQAALQQALTTVQPFAGKAVVEPIGTAASPLLDFPTQNASSGSSGAAGSSSSSQPPPESYYVPPASSGLSPYRDARGEFIPYCN